MPNELTRQLLEDELMHYGVMGMHWGVRRYQPYGKGGYVPEGEHGRFVGRVKQTKGGYRKALTKLQKQRDKSYAIAKKYGDEGYRIERGVKNNENRWSKNKIDKNLDKASRKFDVSEEHEARTAEIDKEIQRIIDDAMDHGFNVNDANVKRVVTTGNKAATSVLATFSVLTLGSPLFIGLTAASADPRSVESKRYWLERNGSGGRGSQNHYT